MNISVVHLGISCLGGCLCGLGAFISSARLNDWLRGTRRRSPLMFLVLSVACFSAGLVAFAYSSGQHPVTSTITTVFSAFSSFGLTAVSAWFVSERYVFVRHKGKKWLADVLDDASDQFVAMPGVRWFKRVPSTKSKIAIEWSGNVLRRASTGTVRRLRSLTVGTFTTHHNETASSGTTILEDIVPNASSPEPMVAPGSPTLTDTTRFSADPDGSIAHVTVGGSEDQGAVSSAPRTRFANLVRNVMMVHRTTNSLTASRPKRRSNTLTAETPTVTTERVVMPKSSRVAGLVPKLRNMVPTQDIAAHAALVRHIEVSIFVSG